MGKSPGNTIAQSKQVSRLADTLIVPIINALPGAIVVVDRGGSIVAVNDAWRALANGEGDKAGTRYVDLAEAIFGEGTQAALARVVSGADGGLGTEGSLVSTLALPQRWLRVHAAPLRDFSRKLIAIHYEDVSELRRLSEESIRIDLRLAAAEEAERRRIARELHDSTGQYLSAASMDVARLNRRLALGQTAGDIVKTLTGTLREAQKDLRSFSYLLHPPTLDDVDLSVSLRQFLKGFGDRAGLRISLNLRCATECLPKPDQFALFRVMQEALVNVHRHARARCVSVILRRAGGEVLMEIEDDGIGMAGSRGERPNEVAGVGLLGMHARLQCLGGKLEVIDTISGGVALRAILPDRRA